MNLLPWQLWLIIGAILFVIELLVPLPTFLIAGALGLAAIITAAIAIVLPIPALQILVWMLVSAILARVSRQFIPKDSSQLQDASEGVTLTAIAAGESGRVQYEGGSWKAKCDDPQIAIAAKQKVIVLRRQGTTLIVVPESWLNH
jgi:membrane protein implicated in regulation of membrane protease activity